MASSWKAVAVRCTATGSGPPAEPGSGSRFPCRTESPLGTGSAATSSPRNTISGSGGAAIEIEESAGLLVGNQVARNRGALNGGLFINLLGAAEEDIAAPAFSSSTQSGASGAGAEPGALVRVFHKAGSAPGEIAGFLAETVADEGGRWAVAYPSAIAAGTMVAANQSTYEAGDLRVAFAGPRRRSPPAWAVVVVRTWTWSSTGTPRSGWVPRLPTGRPRRRRSSAARPKARARRAGALPLHRQRGTRAPPLPARRDRARLRVSPDLSPPRGRQARLRSLGGRLVRQSGPEPARWAFRVLKKDRNGP